MKFRFEPLKDENLEQFIHDMQEAFRMGAMEGMEETDENMCDVLPRSHILDSLNHEGSSAYTASVDGEIAGGAVVITDPKEGKGELAFLYVKYGIQSKGIGQKMWKEIERLHPEIHLWETCTPYFDKRNIHFYVNRLGFHIVHFYTSHYPDPNDPDSREETDDRFSGMFAFEKVV